MSENATFLEGLFKQAYKKQDHKRSMSTNIHVSDLITFCPREYYLCFKHDRPYHPYTYWPMQSQYDFDVGHAIQRIQVKRLMTQGVIYGSWICRHCKRMEIGMQIMPGHKARACPACRCKAWKPEDIHFEIPFALKTKPKSQIVVTGHIDYGLLVDDSGVIITDSKSMSVDYFDKLGVPSPDYRRQVQLYMWGTNHKNVRFLGEPREDIPVFNGDQALIAYGVKGSRRQPIQVREVEQDKPFIKRIEKALQTLAKSFEAKRCPTRICKSQKDMMAKRCSAREVCFDQNLNKGRK